MIGVIAIGGEPATGKSKLMRTLISMLGPVSEPFRSGLLTGYAWTDRLVAVLGDYSPDRVYPGTDCLSMAVQPFFNRLLEAWATDPFRANWVILYEGDRLFNDRSLSLIKTLGLPHKFYLVTACPETLAARHASRDNQNASWLKGRATKLANLVERYDPTVLHNNTGIDLLSNAHLLLTATIILQEELRSAPREAEHV